MAAARVGGALVRHTFRSVVYERLGSVATLTLNRPARLNAIDAYMPGEIAKCMDIANRDDDVHAVIVTGAGRAFCSGYDLIEYAQTTAEAGGDIVGTQKGEPYDAMRDYSMMSQNTRDFMSLWRSNKPTIAKIRGFAVAGGSDIALCCDMICMASDAKIGYPPARVWGVPTTAMWVYRLGPEKAKRMLLTGDLVSGTEAKEMGLVLDAVPEADLDAHVDKLAARVASVPRSQLQMMKLLVNQAVDNWGLAQTQQFATLFDGIARNDPVGHWFKETAEAKGYKEAVRQRDSGEPIAVNVQKPSYPDPHDPTSRSRL